MQTREIPTPIYNQKEESNLLLQTADRLLLSSTLGEFKTRLGLIETFQWQLDSELILHYERPSGAGLSTDRREFLRNVFYNLHQYYKQFEPTLDESLQSLCAPIEKKMKDFITLARWDDINYFSLKSASEKSHRMLNKFSRKLEDVLR